MNINLLKYLDAGPGKTACRLLSRPQKNPCAPCAPPSEGRFLFIRPGGMGDMIMLLPALKLVRHVFPERDIDILCERRNAGILKLSGIRAECLLYDAKPLQTFSRLRKRRYAMVFDTEQYHHLSAVASVLSGAPVRVGFMVSPMRNGLYTHLEDYQLDGREDLQFLRLLEPLGIHRPPPKLPGMLCDIPPTALPCELENAVKSPLLVLHPGGNIPAKRIPLDRLIAVAREARSRLGLSIALLGGEDDALAAREFEARADFPCRNLCGVLRLSMAAEFCRRATVFLGPDSGLAHLATALGVPRVTIFGPSDPRKWSIPDPAQRVLCVSLPCRPCSIFGYVKPCRNYECMHRIQTSEVVNAIESLVKIPREPVKSD